jgi:hypothetical protein
MGYLEPGFPFQILQSPTFNNINHIENQRILVVASPDDFSQWELEISIYDLAPKMYVPLSKSRSSGYHPRCKSHSLPGLLNP